MSNATSSANREVIVCAGAVNSPQLLQLSGIGPAGALGAHGITPVLDNPAVGGNLQDHLAVVYSYKATWPTLNDELHSPLGQFIAGVRYLLTRRGPLALSVNHFGGFVRADPEAARVPICSCISIRSLMQRATRPARASSWTHSPASILCFQPTRPTSTGRIDIASADFRRPPRIAPNYLSTEKDREDVLHGGRLLQSHRAHAGDPRLDPRADRARPRRDGGWRTWWRIFARAPPRFITRSAPAGWARPRANSVVDPTFARARYRTIARRRCIGVSDGDLRQHQRAHPHGGAQGGRSDLGRLFPKDGDG